MEGSKDRSPAKESFSSKSHVVVLTFAQQGHINPLLQFARTLASHGCFITFVLPQTTLPPASSSPNLHFEGLPDLLPPERSRGSSFRDSYDSMINIQPAVQLLLHRLHVLAHHPVSLLISDAFILWAPHLASQLSIPCVSFFTSNATAASVIFHVRSLIQQAILPFPRDDHNAVISTQPIDDIPGVFPLLPLDFPFCLTFESSHFRYRFVSEIGDCLLQASAIILNTFEELEPEPIAALRKHKPIYPVGPLLLMSGSPTRLDVNYWAEDDKCLQWLDKQEPSSVLYVSFGSVASLPLPHFKELAAGIEASDQPFLWVIRPDSAEISLDELLPDGFLPRTKDRGLIISWAPQLLVLSHRSVGAFLTHGGWNSIIENLSTGGVPMICWPHVAEQRLNRRLLVDQLKIGMEFRHSEDGGVEKEEIENTVRSMMQGQEGKDMRKTATKWRDTARKAVEAGGSSQGNFEAVINSVLHAKA